MLSPLNGRGTSPEVATVPSGRVSETEILITVPAIAVLETVTVADNPSPVAVTGAISGLDEIHTGTRPAGTVAMFPVESSGVAENVPVAPRAIPRSGACVIAILPPNWLIENVLTGQIKVRIAPKATANTIATIMKTYTIILGRHV